MNNATFALTVGNGKTSYLWQIIDETGKTSGQRKSTEGNVQIIISVNNGIMSVSVGE